MCTCCENAKLIKGLKKVIKRLKPHEGEDLDMSIYDEDALAKAGLWKKSLYGNYDHHKTAKKLFGIKTDQSIFSVTPSTLAKMTKGLKSNEVKVVELFDTSQNIISIKEWRKNAKKVLKEIGG